MKIYFEDCSRVHFIPLFKECRRTTFIVDAKDGVSNNIERLETLLQNNRDLTIHTNSLLAFSNRYAWNKNLGVPEIYIRVGKTREFVRIDKLTNRQLKWGHNLAKMYLAGEFKEAES